MEADLIKMQTRFKIQGVLIFALICIIGYMLTLKDEPEKIIVPKIDYIESPAKIIKIPGKEIRDTVTLNGDTIIIENEVNKKLLADLLKVRDSVTLLNKYIDAIKINRYKGSVDFEHATASYTAVTTGTLDSIQIGVTLKEREIELPPELKPKGKLLAGPGIMVNYGDLKPALTIGAGYQSKKGNLTTIDLSTNKDIFVSYKFNVFR